ncbi:MAG: hypothetical protein OGMRLDGQ_003251 [Candidatus Fervidibacter sp.]
MAECLEAGCWAVSVCPAVKLEGLADLEVLLSVVHRSEASEGLEVSEVHPLVGLADSEALLSVVHRLVGLVDLEVLLSVVHHSEASEVSEAHLTSAEHPQDQIHSEGSGWELSDR